MRVPCLCGDVGRARVPALKGRRQFPLATRPTDARAHRSPPASSRPMGGPSAVGVGSCSGATFTPDVLLDPPNFAAPMRGGEIEHDVPDLRRCVGPKDPDDRVHCPFLSFAAGIGEQREDRVLGRASTWGSARTIAPVIAPDDGWPDHASRSTARSSLRLLSPIRRSWGSSVATAALP